MLLSELDFVWLVVYFDTNLRPIHAGVCKGAKFTRWYEYGGVSIGGFPRTIKTVRRDHIGTDVGVPDAKGYVLPDVRGPEMEYLDYELEKEVEWLSPHGFLYSSSGQIANGPMDIFKKAMASELTYFVTDAIQVKQLAAYCLLGYCTSQAPDAQYPFPHVKLSRTIPGGKLIDYYYRQSCTQNLMMQEANAGGVRAIQLVPSFPPYMEALPHPMISVGVVGGVPTLHVTPSNGIEGTLPASIVNDTNYEGAEKAHGTNKLWSEAANVKVRVPPPGENAQVTKQATGPIGASKAKLAYQLQGGTNNHSGSIILPYGNATSSTITLPLAYGNPVTPQSYAGQLEHRAFDNATFWAVGEGMLDSVNIKLAWKDNTGKLMYTTPDGEFPLN
jgi:hypothetical protein